MNFDFLKNKKLAYLTIIFLCISNLCLLSLRQYPVGVDTYNYLSFIQGTDLTIHGKNIFVQSFFAHLPNNLFYWNLMAMVFLGLASYAISKIGAFFNPVYGVWAGVIAWMAFYFQYSFFAFEPASIGLAIGLAGTYLFFKNNSRIAWDSGFLFCLAFCFWYGIIFFLFPLAFLDKRLLPVLIGIIIFTWSDLIAAIIPVLTVNERTPVLGLAFLFVYFLRWGGFEFTKLLDIVNPVKWFDFRFKKELVGFIVCFAVLTAFSSKFMFLSFPFLAINLTNFVEKEKQLIIPILVTIFVSVFMLYGMLSVFHPTQGEMDITKKLISIDANVQNDWSFGHYIKFLGGEPSARYGNGASIEVQKNSFVCDSRPVLTVFDLNSDFRKVFSEEGYTIYICSKGVEKNDV